MASIKLSGIGTIYSGDAKVSGAGKTLIITAHGRSTGVDFTPAYTTSLQFASDNYGALLAALTDAIAGKISARQIALIGSKAPDHALAFYESDPSPAVIENSLRGAQYDVLAIKNKYTSTRQSGAPTLSGVIAQLKKQSLTYPAILGLFCRVVKNVSTGESLMVHDVSGAKLATMDEIAFKQRNAIAIAQALKAAKKAT
jgi:hypothetical protein